jgi:prophage maintenance system killer protein
MEHRDDGLLVDYSGSELQSTGQRVGNYPVVFDAKQEREHKTLDQETRLMRAMNEIREYTPKQMTPDVRQKFAILCEGIFKKHGITDANYREYFGHLGTTDQLHR